LPFIRLLATQGYQKACLESEHLRNGLNLCQGQMTHANVAAALQLPFVPAAQLLVS
jgi:alanine dehydrogenase